MSGEGAVYKRCMRGILHGTRYDLRDDACLTAEHGGRRSASGTDTVAAVNADVYSRVIGHRGDVPFFLCVISVVILSLFVIVY